MSKFTRVMVSLRWPALLLPLTGLVVALGISGRTAPDPSIQISAFITTMVTIVFAFILLVSQIDNAVLVTRRRRESREPTYTNRAYAGWSLLLYLLCAVWLIALGTVSAYDLVWMTTALSLLIAGSSVLCWLAVRKIRLERPVHSEYWQATGRATRNNGVRK